MLCRPGACHSSNLSNGLRCTFHESGDDITVFLLSLGKVFLETHTSDVAFLKEVCRSFQAAFDHLDVKM